MGALAFGPRKLARSATGFVTAWTRFVTVRGRVEAATQGAPALRSPAVALRLSDRVADG